MTRRLLAQVTHLRFATVLDVQRARNDERVARAGDICVSPQFWTSEGWQPFSAAFPSSLSQKLFPAAFLSSLSHSLSQKLFSAAFLSSQPQQPYSAIILPWSEVGGQLLTSSCCGQGWWSAIAIILLWSRVGGQLLTSSCCGQGLVVSYCYDLAVVRGPWSAIAAILLWSGVGGQLLTPSCCGQGLVVSQ